ncbi:MAG: alpha/beta hydrolase [Actinobacteria bacterium]|nr:alpha/beta hydrolase [Actinomycetota bacterium]
MPTSLEQQFIETPVGKVQLFRGGTGEPFVYLHSAAGDTTSGTLEALADEREVFVPVFPGFNESEGIEQIDDMEDAVFHLLDVWDALGLDAPPVMGLSLGAWMAAELATRYPDRVGALILVNPVGLYLPDAPVQELFGRSPGELAEEMFADQSNPMAQVMHAMSDWVGDVGQQVEIPLELVLPVYKSLSATAKLGWDPYLHNPRLRKRLRRITAPTLVVRGAQDTFLPAAHAETYAAEVSGARLEVVEGAAHLLPLEKPEELTRLVTQFLAAP